LVCGTKKEVRVKSPDQVLAGSSLRSEKPSAGRFIFYFVFGLMLSAIGGRSPAGTGLWSMFFAEAVAAIGVGAVIFLLYRFVSKFSLRGATLSAIVAAAGMFWGTFLMNLFTALLHR
jgi:hypothetical protein